MNITISISLRSTDDLNLVSKHIIVLPGYLVERPLRERDGRTIPKALTMVPVATLHGAHHYKASTGSPLTH